jgi:hypothetical protein
MTDASELWREHLLLTPTKTPKSILANAITALREAPAWRGVLAYNEFRREAVIESYPPWDPQVSTWVVRPWTDHDDLLATDWLQKAGITVQSKITAQRGHILPSGPRISVQFATRRRLPSRYLAGDLLECRANPLHRNHRSVDDDQQR